MLLPIRNVIVSLFSHTFLKRAYLLLNFLYSLSFLFQSTSESRAYLIFKLPRDLEISIGISRFLHLFPTDIWFEACDLPRSIYGSVSPNQMTCPSPYRRNKGNRWLNRSLENLLARKDGNLVININARQECIYHLPINLSISMTFINNYPNK